MPLHAKLSLLHTLFLENESETDQKNYRTMLFTSKQVSLPKLSSIRQKMKIGQNSIYALFARRPSIMNTSDLNVKLWLPDWWILVTWYSYGFMVGYYPERHSKNNSAQVFSCKSSYFLEKYFFPSIFNNYDLWTKDLKFFVNRMVLIWPRFSN